MDITSIARVCHEANRALQIAQNDPTIPVSASWDDSTEDIQRSATIGVQGILDGNDARASHELWLKTKTEDGYVLGPVKDELLKQHPLLVPFDDLPAAQKVKDDLFKSIVLALQPLLGDAE